MSHKRSLAATSQPEYLQDWEFLAAKEWLAGLHFRQASTPDSQKDFFCRNANIPNFFMPSGLRTFELLMASTNHQIPSSPSESYVETVFTAITKNNGKLNFKDLYTMLVEGGNTSRVHLYRAIAQLTKEGRIKRVKGIGKNGIDYFYYDTRFLKVRPSQLNTSSNAN